MMEDWKKQSIGSSKNFPSEVRLQSPIVKYQKMKSVYLFMSTEQNASKLIS